MNQKKVDTSKNWPLVRNPQFQSDFAETLGLSSTREHLIILKFQQNWTKIVDFLLMANFWRCLLFFDSPSRRSFWFLPAHYLTHKSVKLTCGLAKLRARLAQTRVRKHWKSYRNQGQVTYVVAKIVLIFVKRIDSSSKESLPVPQVQFFLVA